MKAHTRKMVFKEHDGYQKITSRPGRSECYVWCPFCGNRVRAYIWSLSGGGKRCDCGAVVGIFGARKEVDND